MKSGAGVALERDSVEKQLAYPDQLCRWWSWCTDAIGGMICLPEGHREAFPLELWWSWRDSNPLPLQCH